MVSEMKVGPDYWDSDEQKAFDAQCDRILRPARRAAAVGAWATFGFKLYTDVRVGRNFNELPIPKIETLDEFGEPIDWFAERYREKGIDELEQESLIRLGLLVPGTPEYGKFISKDRFLRTLTDIDQSKQAMSTIGSRHLLGDEYDTLRMIASRTNRGRSLLAEHDEVVMPNKRGLLSSFAFIAHMVGDDSVELRLELDIKDYLHMSTDYNRALLRRSTRAVAFNELKYGSHPIVDDKDTND